MKKVLAVFGALALLWIAGCASTAPNSDPDFSDIALNTDSNDGSMDMSAVDDSPLVMDSSPGKMAPAARPVERSTLLQKSSKVSKRIHKKKHRKSKHAKKHRRRSHSLSQNSK